MITLQELSEIKEITARLNGHKKIVRGNHDHDIKYHRTDMGFESIVDCHTMKIAGKDVAMSHFPFLGNEHDEREKFKLPRFQDVGQWLLHGHVHNSWKQKNKMINVGVDVWGHKPVSIKDIEKIILNPNNNNQK